MQASSKSSPFICYHFLFEETSKHQGMTDRHSFPPEAKVTEVNVSISLDEQEECRGPAFTT